MNHYNLTVVPGDGIGHEVMPVALDFLTIAGEMTVSFMEIQGTVASVTEFCA